MDELEHLSSVAEISVTLAGFAALVSILAGRRSDADPRDVSLRLLFALESALLVAGAAMLPIAPAKFGLSEAVVWRGSAGVYLAADVSLTVLILYRARSMGSEAVAARALSRLIWTISAFGQLALVIALSGWLPDRLPALYFTALYLNLINAGLAFLAVAWATFVPDAPAIDPGADG